MRAYAQAGVGNKCKNCVYFTRGHQVAFELYRMKICSTPFEFQGDYACKMVEDKVINLYTLNL